MSSTFSGLEVAKRALFTQQSALSTTGHNISNANTPGYSRQRVNFEQTSPYPAMGRNRPEIPGQIGQGVEAGSVQRVRDEFIDLQYRAEHNKSGYWESRADALSQMEQIMNEPSDTGLSSTMNQFWQSLNDLAGNPEDAGARSVVQQRGIAVADTFNHIADSLTAVQKDLENEINVTTKDINSVVSQIKDLNDQIKAVEPHGYLPNDLYDKRDNLIDELSSMVNINVEYHESSDSAKDIAQGIASIELANSEGQPLSALTDASGNTKPGNMLINNDNETNRIDAQFTDNNGQRVVSNLVIGGEMEDGELTGGNSINPTDFTSNGKLKGLIESHGYQNANGDNEGIYTDMLADIDQLAYAFATAFNEQHMDENGRTLKNEQGGKFFAVDSSFTGDNSIGYASQMDVTQDIKDDEDHIAAALLVDENGDPIEPEDGQSYLGNGENAQELANVKDEVMGDLLGENTSVETFYEGIIGDLGVQAQEANRMAENAGTLEQAVETRRQSVSGVSLDEEMSNMIKFQHAYNAAARNMTVVDEMLDKVINQMGLVGR
ncbi:flagellar hook-associated protein 1 FlgK [Salinibacillus kushneri]|uniref:Flagellar hook-associated protein 1 n=1 Tax=Salinibacillus kushneri TaxID=237682 RepID=A0A1H9YRW6_9BACI|nr:flagellar hook-associated protein FlgK [Salinibacillus kushneri]SES71851.1 flagellar hook-associated protein 1 FlgK [Salinibacillus kushneri]